MSGHDVRIGIVGAGIMGAAHAAMVSGHPRAVVTAVSSRRPEPARALADRWGARVYDDYEQMLASGQVDLLCVATPDHLHADAVIAAADAGIHVACEKPFTTKVADADRAVAAVRSAGTVGMTLFNHRWVPAYAQARELVCSGAIGTPSVAYARKNDRIHVPTQMITWADMTTPAWFLSSHDIDLVTWIFDGSIESVYATAVWGTLRGRGIETPDAIVVQARFLGGAVATFEACWTYPDTYPTMTDSFVELIGSSGVLQLDRKHEQVELATESSFEYPRNQLVNTVHGQPAGAVRAALHHVVDCILSGTQPLVTLESSRHVTAVLEAVHRSVASGAPERVSPAPPTP